MFRLKEIRLENGIKRSELSRMMGINQNTIANYEKEERQAPYETLISFADFFGVSLDELLGREEALPQGDAHLLTAREKRLLTKYRSLCETDRKRVDEILDIFAAKDYV